MEKKQYIQPHIKTLHTPQLLQSFEVSGEGDAEGAAAKRGIMIDDINEEENNVWKIDW